jgi:single-strand DNA-binding protein
VPSLNQLTILGNLGGDPELRYTPDGKAVTNLSVAVTRAWPDQSKDTGWAEETVWFRVDCWDQLAERVAERAKKGDAVLVTGRVKPVRTYSRQDGTTGASLEVRAQGVVILGRREKTGDEDLQFDRPQSTLTDAQLEQATGGGTVVREGEVPVGLGSPARTTEAVDIDDIPF